MMPTDNTYGFWPNSGEIDIMEFVGNEANKFHYTAHFFYGAKGFGSTHEGLTATSDWHIFALEWKEDRLEWYCDGRLYGRYKNPETNWGDWPFDQRFYLILNFTFGGGWGAKDGFDANILPLDYLIDYVRIYQ
jgi:beta-glucanase (GH16 family)